MKTSLILPAFNEENAISLVIKAVDKTQVHEIIVVDNGSTDSTSEKAKPAGARVVLEKRRGYGQACLTGVSTAQNPDIYAFLDADFSDDPTALPGILDPIQKGSADMVIGSRVLGNAEKGALTPVQKYGNWLASTLLSWLFSVRYTDLGPFRAIRADAFRKLKMRDKTFGWTVEMQIKAAVKGLRVSEVPVPYKKRVGTSKISGTFRGVVLASAYILSYLGAAVLYKFFRLDFLGFGKP